MSKAPKLKPDLSYLSLTDPGQQKYQLSISQLIKESIKNKEGVLSHNGALVIDTGEFTGRSPKDRYIVKDSHTEALVNWGEVNIPIEEFNFDKLLFKMSAHLARQKSYYVHDGYACAYKPYRLHVRTISETAYQSLFVNNLLYTASEAEPMPRFDWTVIAAPSFHAIPRKDGTSSPNFTIINFRRKIILIGGTGYAGEIKKAIFSVLNYLLPKQGVLPMHCSANVGKIGDTALFFGLSGTGKTTLSADPKRRLIGDDEHGWSGKSIFNFEAGCYAKTAGLTREKEPQIYNAIQHGTILENVGFMKGTLHPDYADTSKTENTRAAYPLKNIDNAEIPAVSYSPKVIFFLTCDAFGVLPPMAKLSRGQAEHFFLAGYTSKVSGTEIGVIEPKATFSACFGQAFLPLHPSKYSALFTKYMVEYGCEVWLINTGWIGGGYGKGKRIPLEYTRQMISAVLQGHFKDRQFQKYGRFELAVPRNCPEIPDALFDPRSQWNDPLAYDEAEADLFSQFNRAIYRLKRVKPELEWSTATTQHTTLCL